MTISLVLRVAPEALAAGRLAGEAELVGAGAVAVVRDADELIAFLRLHTATATPTERGSEPATGAAVGRARPARPLSSSP